MNHLKTWLKAHDMTQLYAFTVSKDTRWPEGPKGPVLQATSEEGFKFMGWWDREQFNEWVAAKSANITEHADGTIRVVAPLTAKLVRAMKGYR